jgi:hypothetical protein
MKVPEGYWLMATVKAIGTKKKGVLKLNQNFPLLIVSEMGDYY